MSLPLIILAVLAIVAGFGFVSHTVLGEYVPEHHSFGMVGIVSIITLLLGVGGAWVLYRGKTSDPVNIQLFARKFYFDEFYAVLIRNTQGLLATVSDFLDKLLIDSLAVRGGAGLAAGAGNLFRRIQTGNIQGYAFLFGLGVLLILFLALSH